MNGVNDKDHVVVAFRISGKTKKNKIIIHIDYQEYKERTRK